MLWLAGLVPLALVVTFAVPDVQLRSEADLARRVDLALDSAGHHWAEVTFRGRDAKLRGQAFDSGERDNALAVVADVWGVRTVSDRVDLQTATTPYSWRVTYKSNRIKIKGFVPSSDDRTTILGFLKANIPDAEIDDRMKVVAGGPARELWLGAVSFALTQLGRMKSGGVRLDGTQLVITGEAKTPAAYELLRNALSAEVPVGLQLARNEVIPPRIKPFTWAAHYEGQMLTLTGYLPQESDRKDVLNAVRQSFFGVEVTDRMELATGAPGSWSGAIAAALSQLARLESGRVTFSEIDVKVSGVVRDRSIADSVAEVLRQRLPADFKPQVSLQVASASHAESRSDASTLIPAFRVLATLTRLWPFN
ncbi:MAG: BON domain-containing protein [Pseudomonadota bacterium]|nr:BON domain-containing protein [Pseudomonadota bacterium]